MRTSTSLLCLALAAVAACHPTPLAAQTFAANTGTDPVVVATPPNRDKVMAAGPRRHVADTQMYGKVRNGVYTVDGMVAKLKLNYDLTGVDHLYFFLPGVGTAVVSTVAPKDEVVSEAELQGNELSFTAGEHRFLLSGVALANSKGTPAARLYVHLDRGAWGLSKLPMVGFGDEAERPYSWPGALTGLPSNPAQESRLAPPVPVVLLPSTSAVHVAVRQPAPATATTVSPVSLRPVALR